MANPQELSYTEEHEWLKIDGDSAVVGITAYAAEKLGDVVFVELPKVGAAVVAGTVVGEIESTKSVGELYAPATGTVLEVNDGVVSNPELVNEDPFGAGWLIKISITDVPSLLSADEYTALTGD